MAKQRTSTRRKSSASKKNSPGFISAVGDLYQALRSNPETQASARRSMGWGLLFLSVISLLACISYFFTGSADQSVAEAGAEYAEESRNWLGFLGAKIADLIIYRGFGVFGLVLPVYGFVVGLVLLEPELSTYSKRSFKYVLFVLLWGSLFISYIIILINSGPDAHYEQFELGGGFGYHTNIWLFSYIGKVGVAFLLLFTVMVFTIVNFKAEVKASQLVENLATRIRQQNTNIRKNQEVGGPLQPPSWKQKLYDMMGVVPATQVAVPLAEATPANKPATTPKSRKKKALQPLTPIGSSNANGLSLEVVQPVEPTVVTPPPASLIPPVVSDDLELKIEDTVEEAVVEVVDDAPKKFKQLGDDNVGEVVGEEGLIEKIVPEADQERENIEDEIEWEKFDPTQELSDYERPTLELLEDHGAGNGREVNREELEGNKNKIIDTLKNYGIEIVKIKATIGPTVTLYEIVPAPGVRISKIRNLEDDIALNLAALGIRIIAPIPGKGTIGIEVPNSNPETVSLRGLLSTVKFQTTKAELPIGIGRTISNEAFIADLNKMPHLLIAGATGQGKSVGLNTVITSLLYSKHPAEIKFVLIDPKKVEMSLYTSLSSHFLAMLPDQKEPIITDVRDAVDVLKSLSIEMDNRYDLLKKARVRNLSEYNAKFTDRKLNPRKGHKYLPYIVLIIDELADMMMTAGKEVEMPIARLAQLARAVGIHLVVATQRPSVNVITGIIKANFPARMSYRVISKVDSRTILDANGADQLVGRGDLLLSTGSDLIRIQNAFIDTPEVERVVDFISKQRGFPEPYYLPEMPRDGDSDEGDDELEPFEKDSRFDEAARLIVRYQIGSASLIQRKMKLGYNRAGRIIDQLERAGIVGAHSGSKARDVLLTDEAELERYLSNL